MPDAPAREVFRLLDEEPVIDAELMALGAGWPATTARRSAKCCGP